MSHAHIKHLLLILFPAYHDGRLEGLCAFKNTESHPISFEKQTTERAVAAILSL
jgi:hypothetical protein